MNETIGKLAHHCGHEADVRKNKKGKLYLMCPNCGQLHYNLPGGQDYILINARMGSPDHMPEPEAPPVTVHQQTARTPQPAAQAFDEVIEIETAPATPEPAPQTEKAEHDEKDKPEGAGFGFGF